MRTNLILAILAALLSIPTILTIQGEQLEFTDYADVPRLFDGFTPDNIGVVQISSPRKLDDGSIQRDADGNVVRDSVQFQRSGTDQWAIRQ